LTNTSSVNTTGSRVASSRVTEIACVTHNRCVVVAGSVHALIHCTVVVVIANNRSELTSDRNVANVRCAWVGSDAIQVVASSVGARVYGTWIQIVTVEGGNLVARWNSVSVNVADNGPARICVIGGTVRGLNTGVWLSIFDTSSNNFTNRCRNTISSVSVRANCGTSVVSASRRVETFVGGTERS